MDAVLSTPPNAADIDVLLDQASGFSAENRAVAVALLELLRDDDARDPGIDLLALLLELRMDFVTAMAGMVFFAVQKGVVDPTQLPGEVAGVVAALLPLQNIHVLSLNDSTVLSSASKSQADNVRHMLIALIDDPRVAVITLAERAVTLRRAKTAPPAQRATQAREAMEFFAPLANRLGIWQLKWVLEDLAFSYLRPDEYRNIAVQLDGRRDERERQVEAIRQDLEFRLSAEGIDAEVDGRAKHIYSIWRKMKHKAIPLEEVRDVQALRVLVPTVEACYRVLGVVHTSWPHIPSEFDDYVANPKENGYRSIHTAVIGPAGKNLEVQIRTREMHEQSELGMCAHWAYKEDGRPAAGSAGKDARSSALWSRKVDWLRSVLDWHDEVGSAINGGYMAQERVYVTTPQGHVIDLSPGATPVDFAYRVHTEIGHRCRGARVDGRRVPLNRRLATGERVEIHTGDEAVPKREWLNPALGYVTTARAREKIQAWFKTQMAESNVRAGLALLEDTLARLGSASALPDREAQAELAERAGYDSPEALFLALGVGDLLVFDLVRLLSKTHAVRLTPAARDAGDNAQEIIIRGRDRDGLLRDVMATIADLAVPVEAAHATVQIPGVSASITMRLEVADVAELAGVINAIRRVPEVGDVRVRRPS